MRDLPLTTESYGEILPKDRCPICGECFDPVKEVNVCTNSGGGTRTFSPEDLITENDDYEWCQ